MAAIRPTVSPFLSARKRAAAEWRKNGFCAGSRMRWTSRRNDGTQALPAWRRHGSSTKRWSARRSATGRTSIILRFALLLRQTPMPAGERLRPAPLLPEAPIAAQRQQNRGCNHQVVEDQVRGVVDER